MLKLIILLTIPVCLFEGLPLIKKKRWKELTAFGIIIGICLILVIGKVLGMPTPVELLYRWLAPVGQAIFKQF